MKLVLVNAPGINILPPLTGGPTPTSANTYLKVTAPATVKGAITVTVSVDTNNFVDNMAMCTQIQVTIIGTIGEGTAQKDFEDSLTLNGSSIYSTVNNKSIILKDDNVLSTQGSKLEVISCGQTSTSVD